MTGKCRGCGEEGVVGELCTGKVCSAHGYCFVPLEYSPTTDAQPGGLSDPLLGRRIDEYIVVRRLGEGGFGAVYLGLQLPVRLKAAIKILKMDKSELAETQWAKFQAEAEALAQLTHPNVVRLLKFGAFEGQPYLVMEYVERGRDLRAEMDARRKAGTWFTPSEVLHLMTLLLKALGAAHAGKLIHRDIKPQNIMLQDIGDDAMFVRVLDFGLAKVFAEDSRTTAIQGTPLYMAPEQFAGRQIGPWTDLYAVGILLCELVTGRLPFRARSYSDLFTEKTSPSFDLSLAVPCLKLAPEMDAFLRSAIAHDPEARTATVDAFRAGMAAALRGVEALPLGATCKVPPETAVPDAATDKAASGDATGDTLTAEACSPPERAEPERLRERHGSALVRLLAERKVVTAAILLLVLGAGLAFALFYRVLPWGRNSEFQVNSHTPGGQEMPSVSAAGGGRFVAAWHGRGYARADYDIFIRSFDGAGNPLSEESQANTFGPGNQMGPVISAFSDGGFAVVWLSEQQDGSGDGVFAQWFASDSSIVRSEVRVNSCTEGNQTHPHAVASEQDALLVVWQSDRQDGDGYGVYGQLYDRSGSCVGGETRLNRHVQGPQGRPWSASLPGGRWVVVWESYGQDGDGFGVFGRVLDGDLAALGDEFQVNTSLAGDQRYPVANGLPDGRIVVAWTANGQDGSESAVVARAFLQDGSAATPEFRLNSHSNGKQMLPRLVADCDGTIIAAWMSEGQDGSGWAAVGRAFTLDGTALGKDVILNLETESDQRLRAIARLECGSFIALWESLDQDGSSWGIFGRGLLLSEFVGQNE